MRYFPIFMDLDPGNTVLVYGGGEDAARKVRLLLKTGVAIDHIRSAPDEHAWSPLIEGQTADGRTAWRLAS